MHARMRLKMAAAVTSVRVSRETLREIERLQAVFRTKTADATIRKLIKDRRSRALDRLQGSWPGVSPFTEADRLGSDG